MIERAAKAAYLDINPDWPGLEWENLAAYERRGYEGSMRAAVKAMMEPSESVLEEGNYELDVWQTFIGAILDEEE
jgi:hypothetical protein